MDFDVSDVIVHETVLVDDIEIQRLVQFLLFRCLRVFFVYLAFNAWMWFFFLLEVIFWA